MKKLNKKGFTLIELIVVIAILSILTSFIIPSITGYIAKATSAKNLANCRSLYSQTTMEIMLDQTASIGASPATSNGLTITYSTDPVNKIVTTFVCNAGDDTADLIMK